MQVNATTLVPLGVGTATPVVPDVNATDAILSMDMPEICADQCLSAYAGNCTAFNYNATSGTCLLMGDYNETYLESNVESDFYFVLPGRHIHPLGCEEGAVCGPDAVRCCLRQCHHRLLLF